ncbi:uncharacterized mitochondrial protein atmg00820 [Phtheirospermum japonicum]|uniref:Uncharacterized mitochondrial protein atmg00820 n=1 Tax=Phtheirospermum japonicum TaxID=374723 RepID=A0A830D1H5_9LAMI|nr:uncharacterized mitochondrial protein atmg00820 [Phtheirospermum japonicum]
MDGEFNELKLNHTRYLVPFSDKMNLISNKWIFIIKWKSDGSLDILKARLVTRGFQQHSGIDYFDNFSPVIKPITIRICFHLLLQEVGMSIRLVSTKYF